MAETTGIEWTDRTANFWTGCAKVGPGCDGCYAEAINLRFSKGENWGPHAPRRRSSENNWKSFFKWNRDAAANGMRPRVFTLSMGDFWDNAAPEGARLDALHVIFLTPNLDWQILTKRPGNIAGMLQQAMRDALAKGEPKFFRWLWNWVNGKPPSNVWLGCTVVNQEEADRDIDKLKAVPARIRFLSVEPMLSEMDLRALLDGIGWVICGGESGPGARAMAEAWARSLRNQCLVAGVPFFMKQMGGARDKRGALEDFPVDLRVREFPQ